MWAQNFGFLGIALFSALILTSPFVTALVLLAFILLSIVTSVLFERRTFCRYLCPIGGFIGVYSQVAPVEVRIKDAAVCASHTEKTCYTGSDDGYGCPWFNLPAKVQTNTFCGMCGECLRTCPKDNIALNIRRPGLDLLRTTGRRLDEAFNGTDDAERRLRLFGRSARPVRLAEGHGASRRHTGLVRLQLRCCWCCTVAVVPGLFWLCVRVSRAISRGTSNQTVAPSHRKSNRGGSLFADYAAVLVPLGLAIWMAFTLSFTLVNLSYAWPALSDPFGWGWNLFGTAGMSWTPYVSGLIPYLQIPLLLAGLVAAVALGLRTAREHGQSPWAAVPVSVFSAAAVVGLITLYMA